MNASTPNLVSTGATYGPDGKQPELLYLGDFGGMEGTILPSKAKSAEWTYSIPEKYYGDVTLEITIGDNYERDPVIFSGSIN